MRKLHYGQVELIVSNDVAGMLVTLSTEAADAGRTYAVPVASTRGTFQLIVGQGIALAVEDTSDAPEPEETLASWAYMRDVLEDLQREDDQ